MWHIVERALHLAHLGRDDALGERPTDAARGEERGARGDARRGKDERCALQHKDRQT